MYLRTSTILLLYGCIKLKLRVKQFTPLIPTRKYYICKEKLYQFAFYLTFSKFGFRIMTVLEISEGRSYLIGVFRLTSNNLIQIEFDVIHLLTRKMYDDF